MAIQHSKPSDLAQQVLEKLRHNKMIGKIPSIAVLENLFECLYYASMCREESELVRVTLTLINPENPDPKPPTQSVPERWSSIAFGEKIPLDIKSLTKLSKAADPSSSSLSVYYDDDENIFIWGMIDQALHYQNFLNYESESGSEQPGIFQVSINDIGTLNVLFDYELIATLKQNVLVKRYLDVFTIGPISKILRKNADYLKINLRTFLEKEYPEELFEDWENFLDSLWIQTFSRLLLKIRNYNHGGAILITDQLKDIDIKYHIIYDRLTKSMISFAKESINTFICETKINNSITAGKRTIDRKLYIQESTSWYKKQGIADEIKGCISFIASQSCVDGVVLFNKNMIANGFGAVLRSKRMPKRIFISRTATATSKSVTEVDPRHFGTRHRSMIAYCWNHEQSLGLVISQDGEIRAFTKIEGKLIMWENIKTRQYLKQILIRRK